MTSDLSRSPEGWDLDKNSPGVFDKYFFYKQILSLIKSDSAENIRLVLDLFYQNYHLSLLPLVREARLAEESSTFFFRMMELAQHLESSLPSRHALAVPNQNFDQKESLVEWLLSLSAKTNAGASTLPVHPQLVDFLTQTIKSRSLNISWEIGLEMIHALCKEEKVEGLGEAIVDLLKASSCSATAHKLLKLNEVLYHVDEIEDFRPFISQQNIFSERAEDLSKALSSGQLWSKLWALQQIRHAYPENRFRTLIVGGWYGLLARLLLDHWGANIESLRSIDIDPSCEPIAEHLNKKEVIDNWRFKASTADMYELNYDLTRLSLKKSNGDIQNQELRFDLVVNTSCEHLEHFSNWYDRIPSGMNLLLQSNDFFDEPSHVNCHRTLEEFVQQAPMQKLLFSGTLELEKYRRFMLIGVK